MGLADFLHYSKARRSKMKQQDYFIECLKDITIPPEWEHESYFNDAYPSFGFNGYQIWVAHKDPKQRETGGDWLRFALTLLKEYGTEGWIHQTDSFDEVMQEIQKPISDRPEED
jgi:hypothetical protein